MQCVARNPTILVLDRYDVFKADGSKHGALRILDLDPAASNEMAAVFDHLRRRKQRIASCVFQRGFEIGDSTPSSSGASMSLSRWK